MKNIAKGFHSAVAVKQNPQNGYKEFFSLSLQFFTTDDLGNAGIEKSIERENQYFKMTGFGSRKLNKAHGLQCHNSESVKVTPQFTLK